jgi:integrase
MDQKSALTVVTSTATGLDRSETLIEQVRAFVDSADSKATRRAYAADWRVFVKWCQCQKEELSSALPVPMKTVAMYVADLAKKGRKYATIKRALSGIAHKHRSNGFEWEIPAIFKREMKGIRNEIGTKQLKKAPSTDDVLKRMVATLGVDRRGLRDRAILTVGWVGAFRRSEIVSLDVSDLEFFPEGATATLRKSKTDQEGKGITKGLPFSGNASVCPVRSLRAWLEASGIAQGPVFRPMTRTGTIRPVRLSGEAVAKIVKRACKNADLDPEMFSGHSLRSGFATTAALQGVSLDDIMDQTGHKDRATARGYVQRATVFTRNAAKGLL